MTGQLTGHMSVGITVKIASNEKTMAYDPKEINSLACTHKNSRNTGYGTGREQEEVGSFGGRRTVYQAP